MARTGVTFEQVAAVADAITGEGYQPTINAVRDRIGTGSPNTIHKHLTIWRAARPQAAAAVPELPASLTAAIAAEIEKAAYNARAEVETKLVQSQAEAVELANAGEALETDRDELIEQVANLTTEKDKLAGKAAQQELDLKVQAERIEREQQAAEAARVELAKAQLKIDGNIEKLKDQTSEIERLRNELSVESKGRIIAEQQAAVFAAKLEAMTDRATKAENRADQAEKQSQQTRQEMENTKNQLHQRQSEITAIGRELELTQTKIKEASEDAKKAREEAAELRGRLSASNQNETIAKDKSSK